MNKYKFSIVVNVDAPDALRAFDLLVSGLQEISTEISTENITLEEIILSEETNG